MLQLTEADDGLLFDVETAIARRVKSDIGPLLWVVPGMCSYFGQLF